jgi:hypothetical protein
MEIDMEEYHMHHLSAKIWEYFNTFGSSKNKVKNWDEKNLSEELSG